MRIRGSISRHWSLKLLEKSFDNSEYLIFLHCLPIAMPSHNCHHSRSRPSSSRHAPQQSHSRDRNRDSSLSPPRRSRGCSQRRQSVPTPSASPRSSGGGSQSRNSSSDRGSNTNRPHHMRKRGFDRLVDV